MRRRTVITGIGTVCGLGVGKQAFWEGLLEGRSAVGRIRAFDASGFPGKLASEVHDLDARQHVPKSYRKATKVMARDTELAVVAARLAVLDAGVLTRGSEEGDPGSAIDTSRLGCQIGAGLIAAETQELTQALATARDESGEFSWHRWGTEAGPEGEQPGGGMNNLPPLWLLKYLPNMLACHVTIVHGAEGPSNTITCSESSGLLSLGESMRVIERGDAELCFTGGAESKINLMGMLRLTLAGRVGESGDAESVDEVCRPYDPASKGGVLGEGGGILIVEERAHAEARGATIYAEAIGFGAGQTPPPIFPGSLDRVDGEGEGQDGPDEGLVTAIEAALRDAGITPDQIDVIVPTALGVPVLDRREHAALSAVFGERLGDIPLILLPPAVGNCSAGHGGLAAAAGALSLQSGRLPQRRIPEQPTSASERGPDNPIKHALICSTALGGQNAAVVLRK